MVSLIRIDNTLYVSNWTHSILQKKDQSHILIVLALSNAALYQSHHEGVFEEFFFCWKKVLGIECFFPLQHIFSTFQGHVFALALVGTFKTTYSLIWSKIAAPMYRAKIYDMKFWGWEKGKKF